MKIDRLIKGQVYRHIGTDQLMMYQQTRLDYGVEKYIFTLPLRTPNRYVPMTEQEVLKYIENNDKVREP